MKVKIKDILCPVCKPKYLKEMHARGQKGLENRWKNWHEAREKISKESKKRVKRNANLIS